MLQVFVNLAAMRQVKLCLRHSEVSCCAQSEVKCSAYRAEGTLHARSALHLRSILYVPLAEHLVEKALLSVDKNAFHDMHFTFANIIHMLTNISIVMLRLCRSEVWAIAQVKYCAEGAK